MNNQKSHLNENPRDRRKMADQRGLKKSWSGQKE